jgi:hypothetical protein
MTKHGLLDASTDPAQIERWWKRAPDANIGLRTGIAFDVLDFDGPAAMIRAHVIDPDWKHAGPATYTGKGHHLLIEVTGAKNGAGLMPQLDYRGQNGYIVAPPSIHPNGHEYRWLNSADLPIPAAPGWAMPLLFPPEPERRGPRRDPSAVAGDLADLDLLEELEAIGVDLRPSGAERLVGKCPFHQDDTPSLHVYLNNDPQSFYCFGCTAWGDALNVRRWREVGRLH